MTLSTIWNRLITHQGEIFHTMTGLEFSYQIVGNALYIYRDSRKINRAARQSDFEKAINYLEEDTKEFYRTINAPCYVKALLMDHRIGD